MLEIKALKVFHGQIEAVHGIDIAVSQGQCVTLLGPNGAGKTSTLSAITGTVRATGTIQLDRSQLELWLLKNAANVALLYHPKGGVFLRTCLYMTTCSWVVRYVLAGPSSTKRSRIGLYNFQF